MITDNFNRALDYAIDILDCKDWTVRNPHKSIVVSKNLVTRLVQDIKQMYPNNRVTVYYQKYSACITIYKNQ